MNMFFAHIHVCFIQCIIHKRIPLFYNIMAIFRNVVIIKKYRDNSIAHTYLSIHTSKINDLWSSLNSEEMLQNFLYLYKKKTQVVFFIFHFEQLSFLPYECPGLYRPRPGHSYREKWKLFKMKNKTKNYFGFLFI